MLRRIGCRVSWGRLISSKIFWSTSGYPRGQKHPLEIRAHRQRGGCPGTQTIKEKEEEEEDGAEGLHGAEMLIAVEGVGRKQSRPKHLEPRPPEHHTHTNTTPTHGGHTYRLPEGPDLSRDPGKSQQHLPGGCGMVTSRQGHGSSGIFGSSSTLPNGGP